MYCVSYNYKLRKGRSVEEFKVWLNSVMPLLENMCGVKYHYVLFSVSSVVYFFCLTASFNHLIAPALQPAPSINIITEFSGIASMVFKYKYGSFS